jgi:hypothetical protein
MRVEGDGEVSWETAQGEPVRTLRPTPLWLLLCPFLVAGCIGNSDPPPIPKVPAPGRLAPPTPTGPQVAGEDTSPKPASAQPAGGFLLPSKYMLMTPPNVEHPERPAQYRPMPVPQGVPVGKAGQLPTKTR